MRGKQLWSCFTAFLIHSTLHTTTNALSNDLRSQIYVDIPVDASQMCYRFLNGTHQVGCQSDRDGSEGVLVHVRSKEELQQADEGWKEQFPQGTAGRKFALLLPEELLDGEAFATIASSAHIGAVLVLGWHGSAPKAPGTALRLSADASCPNRRASIYKDWRACSAKEPLNGWSDHWNGKWAMSESGAFFTDVDKPMVRITNETYIHQLIQCHDKFNRLDSRVKQLKEYANTQCAVKLKTFNLGAGSALTCIRRMNHGIQQYYQSESVPFCTKLRDENLFSIFPPIKVKSNEKKEDKRRGRYMVFLTRMDSFSLFADHTPGVYSSLTSAMALLTASRMMSQNRSLWEKASAASNRSVIFAYLHGESFEYIGSTAWIESMKKGRFPSTSTRDISSTVQEKIGMDQLDDVVEVQQLHWREPSTQHVDGETFFAAGGHDEYYAAREERVEGAKAFGFSFPQEDLSDKLTKDSVLPPSSLHAFLREKPTLRAVLRAGFQSTYTENTINSQWDYVNEESFAKLQNSILLEARALVRMAMKYVGVKIDLPAKPSDAEISWVREVSACFLRPHELRTCNITATLMDAAEQLMHKHGGKQETSTFIGAAGNSNVRLLITALHIVSTGEHESTQNVRDVKECQQMEMHDNVHDYTWLPDPFTGTSHCWKSLIFPATAYSPIFDDPDESDERALRSNFSLWMISEYADPTLSMYLVEEKPVDLTVFIVGVLITLLSIGLVWRMDDSTFIVDEGERKAEEGEPL